MLYSIPQLLLLTFQLAALAFSLSWTDEPTTLKDIGLRISHFLNLIKIAISWSSIDDDIKIKSAASNIIGRGNVTAHAQGLSYRFLYQNYASEEQAVFQGYGKENLERRKTTQKKYDPPRVFTNLQRGYFKL